MIDDYRFGRVTIDGTRYAVDVICHGERIEAWRRETGHRVAPVDVQGLLSLRPSVVIFGTGAYGMMRVSRETRALLEENGIDVRKFRTGEAARVSNDLVACGVDAAVAMHLTC